ncbi:hypothetical protein NMG60_11015481, partial [Bertholletia excelsa]
MANTNSKKFMCEICTETLSSNKRFTNNGLCFHPFCIDCAAKYIHVKVIEDRVADVKCPGLDCEQVLDPLFCRSIVSPNLFVKWSDLLFERAIVGFERCYCPNRRCSVLILNECGQNAKKSECPNCKNLFCFACKIPWHAGFRCEESGEMRDDNDIKFGILAGRMKWASCPKCNHCVELRGGCSNVYCRCGTSFCYRCGELVCTCNRWLDRQYGCLLHSMLIILVLFS